MKLLLPLLASLVQSLEPFDDYYKHYFENHFFDRKDTSYVKKMDVESWLANNTAVTEWDNTLPTLIYHGIGDDCGDRQITNFIEVIEQVGKAQGKTLYAECIVIGKI